VARKSTPSTMPENERSLSLVDTAISEWSACSWIVAAP
jgi:hypothetical protein